MCERKNSDGIHVWACGKCGQCIQARKNDWVVRCHAESATRRFAQVLTLTYREKPDGSAPHAARSFNYKDVQTFLKSVRNAAKQEYPEQELGLSYFCVGERGSRKDRVHWHLILWSDIPIQQLGQWAWKHDFKTCFPKGQAPLDKRIHWDRWRHGFVFVEEPNEATFHYMLKYVLKGLYNSENSRGQTRFTKSDWHSAAMVRMSKQPPLGMSFILRRLQEWRQKGIVPVSLNLKVPGYSGFWYPKRKIRETLVYGLHDIAQEVFEETGYYPAQWNALLASVKRPTDQTNEEAEGDPQFTDYERLKYGKTSQNELRAIQRSKAESFQSEIEGKSQQYAKRNAARNVVDQCGGASPCWKCANGLSEEKRVDLQDWLQALRTKADHANLSLDEYYKKHQTKRANPFCQLKDDTSRRKIFNARGKSKFVKDAQQKMQTAARQSDGK